MDFVHVGSVWIHTVAFVIAWGYYGILGRFVLPAVAGSLDGHGEAELLRAIERRALPLLIGSIVLFVVTGSILLATDERYAGLGNLFASGWTTLMFVKHVVIVALVLTGIGVDRWIAAAADATMPERRHTALARVRLGAEAATGLGALVALLTAAAAAT